MADVTVSELATSVGASVDRILMQMKQAGLSHTAADDIVSDEQKQRLLSFLKSSHGGAEVAEAPKKITLKRKTISTLKTGSGSARKTVNVEVRKKRTYVKRDVDESGDLLADSVSELEANVDVVAEGNSVLVASNENIVEESTPDTDVQKTAPANTAEDQASVNAETQESEVSSEAPVDEVVAAVIETPVEASADENVGAKDDSPVVKKPPVAAKKSTFSLVDDAEILRQRAAVARKKREADLIAEKARAAKKLQDEKEQKENPKTEKASPEKTSPEKAKQERSGAKSERHPNVTKSADDSHKHGKKREKAAPTAFEEGEDKSKHRKTAGKAVKKVAAPKKASSALDYVEDVSEIEEVIHTPKRRKLSSNNGRRPIKLSNKPANNRHGFKKPTAKITYDVELPEEISVSELASRMKVKGGEVVKQLMKLGTMATMNQSIDQETAQLVVEELGHRFVLVSSDAIEHELKEDSFDDSPSESVSRAPVVTVMGHVDHGKTSLLDYIRKAKVASGEAGGITQHIGAYRVGTSHGELTFLDTPGHAAFTAMRARGAQCTDIVILVVAADDGVMPQTEEAIQHARAAGVPIVVAINKIDKEGADPDRVKNELSAKDVIPDDWGGDTQFIQVSAHTGEGIDSLLEAVALQSELLELKAPIAVPPRGVVIEARMDKGRGVIATVLVQAGMLKVGEILLAGQSFGRVRVMTNERGERVNEASPSTPVELLGLDVPPNAGDEFIIVKDERKAREVAGFRAEKERQEKLQRQQASKLENMFADMSATEKKVLPIVLKTDVRGSLEAIQSALLDIGNDEVQVNFVGGGVGAITENDLNLALTSGAIVLGFNVRADASARKTAESEVIEIRYYSIIYQLIDEVRSALGGMLDPERVEEIVGIADVRDVFRSPKFGQVAGCMVVEGAVHRNKPIRVLRENVVIFEGELESLRRFKDDVNEVRNGIECGIGVKNYDVKVGDQIEVFEVKEVAREL